MESQSNNLVLFNLLVHSRAIVNIIFSTCELVFISVLSSAFNVVMW